MRVWMTAAVVALAGLVGPPALALGDGPCPLCEQEGEDPLGWIDGYTSYMDGKVKLSGEVRLRIESRSDFDFDDSLTRDYLDETWGLGRVRLKGEFAATDNVRFVGELQSSHAFELDNNNARSVRFGPGASQDRLDIFQAYVEVHDLENMPQLTIQAGRYTLIYGTQRLVGAFAWSNVGRSFQGVRLKWEEPNWWAHLFYNDVVVPFDEHANKNDANNNLAGLYVQYHGYDWGVSEVYVLRHDQDDIGAASIDGRETYTFGTRAAAKLGENKEWDVDGEVAYQTGQFARHVDHEAFAVHVGGGYTFKDVAWTPRVGSQYNFATGDEDPTDSDNETFDNLFPTNHLHYGYMDLFGWRNIHDLSLEVSATPCDPVLVKVHYHAFWLDEPGSAPWQNAGGGTVRAAMPGASDFVGHELDLIGRWTFHKHVAIEGGWGHFFAGDFVDDTGPADDADWLYFQTTLKI